MEPDLVKKVLKSNLCGSDFVASASVISLVMAFVAKRSGNDSLQCLAAPRRVNCLPR